MTLRRPQEAQKDPQARMPKRAPGDHTKSPRPWRLDPSPGGSSPGGSNPTLEAQLQPSTLKPSPGCTNLALEAQILPWSLKSCLGGSELAPEAHIQPWYLNSSPGGSKPALETQIQPLRLKASPGGRRLKATPGGSTAGGYAIGQHTDPKKPYCVQYGPIGTYANLNKHLRVHCSCVYCFVQNTPSLATSVYGSSVHTLHRQVKGYTQQQWESMRSRLQVLLIYFRSINLFMSYSI